MSRVLFLLPSVPDPADSGAKLRNLMLLRLAAERHEVDAIAFGRPDEAERLAKLADRSRVLPPPIRTRWQRAASIAASQWPDMAERLWSAEFADAVSCMHGEADLVQAEAIEMARYLALTSPGKRVYDAHNPEFLLQRRLSEATRGRTAAAYSRLQWRRLERFERAAVLGSRLNLAVSHHDANQLRALGRGACVSVVPNGLKTSAFQFKEPDPEAAPNLLFVGKLDYRPNADAVRWLIEHVLPRVFSSVPTARLFVVGANPPEWLVKAGQHDDRIAVTGYVADERPYLERCCALLLPVQVAAGSRLKALVALASGVPIVSTALGMEGLEAQADQDYLQAESPEDWATAVNRVLSIPGMRADLARRGRQLVEHHYAWDVIRPQLHEAYARIGL